MGKPTRSVRRFIRRRAGAVRQNKGKGRGKGAGAFLASLTDDEVDVFLGRKGKGKGKGKRTSGKGLGRKHNPIGRDGTVMACNTCGSENHFANNCDGSGPRGRNSQQITFAGTSSSSVSGPLGDLTFSSSAVLMISDSVSSNSQRQAAEPGEGWAVPPAEPYSQAEPQEPTPMPQAFNPWAEFSHRSAMEAASPQRIINPFLVGRCTRCGANLEEGGRCWRCFFRPGDEFRTTSEPGHAPGDFSRPSSGPSFLASEPPRGRASGPSEAPSNWEERSRCQLYGPTALCPSKCSSRCSSRGLHR